MKTRIASLLANRWPIAAGGRASTRASQGTGTSSNERNAVTVRSHPQAPSAASAGGRVLLLTAIALFAALVFGAVAQGASKVERASFGSPGSAGGQFLGFSSPGDLVINRNGAGGASAGDLYVLDGNRVQQFSPSGSSASFVRTWGYDVVASGQGNTGADEQQAVAVKGTGGKFSLSVTTAGNASGVATIGSNVVTNVTPTLGSYHVGDAINAPPAFPANSVVTAIGPGTLTLSSAATQSVILDTLTATENTGATGTGSFASGATEVTGLVIRSGGFAPGEAITGTGIQAGTTILAVGAGTLTLDKATTAAGTGAVLTASDIPFDASAAEVKAALEALPGVGSGNLTVTGGPGGATGLSPYLVSFSDGPLSGNDLVAMGKAETALEGASKAVTVSTYVLGGGFEICRAASSPADVCKAATANVGVPSPGPGTIFAAEGVAVDQSSGNVYVSQQGAHRIDLYSAAGSFQGAFGYDVIPSGATGTGTVTPGSNTITAVSTTSKAFSLTASQNQFLTGVGIPPGTFLTGNPGATTLTMSNPATAAATGAGTVVTAPAGAGNVPGNERQRISVNATAGTFKLRFTAPNPQPTGTNPATTASIPFNASAAEVESALAALANVGVGNVTVSGPAAGTYVVEFTGSRYADTNVAQMTTPAGSPPLSGGSASVVNLREGGSFEFCTVASGCQAGSVGASAGQPGNSASRLAVNPLDGHILTSSGNGRIEEYAPSLNGAQEVVGASFVRSFGWDVVTEGPDNANQMLALAVSATAGSFKLTFGAQSTADLPFNASAAALQAALEALPSIGAGNISVSGGPGNAAGSKPYGIAFKGALGGQANGAVTAGDGAAALSGGAASEALRVTTINPGGGAGFEVCRAADYCKAGTTGAGAGQFAASTSTTGVAVDGDGTIYVTDAPNGCSEFAMCRVYTFDSATLLPGEFAPDSLSFTAGNTRADRITVDPANEHVWFLKSGRVVEFDNAGNDSGDLSPPAAATGIGASNLAVVNSNRVFVASPQAGKNRIAILEPVPAPSAEMTSVSSVTTGSATFGGKVTIPSPGGPGFEVGYQFEYSADGGFHWSKAPIPAFELGNGAAGGESSSCPSPQALVCNVTQAVSGLQPGVNYLVRLAATTSSTATSPTLPFATDPVPPAAAGASADPVGATTAKLYAFVNPNNRPTTYRFDWGTDSSYGKQAPAEFEPLIGSGGEEVKVTANLSGLEASTTYHFRIVATSPIGSTVGPDRHFTTLNVGGAPDLPNNRAYELVSPANKRPQGSVKARLNLPYQVAEDGQSVIFPIQLGLQDTDAGGDTLYMAKRASTEWQSTKISPPSLVPSPNNGLVGNATSGFVEHYSPDLSCGFIYTINPLTEDTPARAVELGVANLYRRNADGSHTLVTEQLPANPEIPPMSGSLNVEVNTTIAGAAPDCSKVYFLSTYHYLPNPSGLYEWDEGVLRDAGRLPGGATPGFATPGSDVDLIFNVNGEGTRYNSVSADGSRFFFTATSNDPASNGKQAVFVREEGQPTLEVSRKQGGAKENVGARYEAAAADGTHVFFAANYGLTAETSQGPSEGCSAVSGSAALSGPCDLYDYEVETGELTDLSADSNPADTKGAAVVGVVDLSDDGELVYFAARGQLLPGQGKTYAQNTSGAGSANVYFARGGELTYVTTVVAEDLDGLSQVLIRGASEFKGWKAEATPDGEHLVFPSVADLTGYDSGGITEAYLYSAQSDELTCISCRPDGKPSIGIDFETLPLTTTFIGSNQYATPRRKISDDGSRVFFTMPDPLAAGAVAGDENVYQWEDGEVYLLLTAPREEFQLLGENIDAYRGASASGDDVFIRTKRQLSPHDIDTVFDLYDVRVDGGMPPPPPPEIPCNAAADECQGAPTPQPAAPAPASPGFVGPGNPPEGKPTPKPCARGKVRRRGKCVKRRKGTGRGQASRSANNNRGGAK